MPHQGVAQSAFAGAVGAHQGVHFTLAERQVHAAQDLLAPNGHMQIFDRKNLAHQFVALLTLSWRLTIQGPAGPASSNAARAASAAQPACAGSGRAIGIGLAWKSQKRSPSSRH